MHLYKSGCTRSQHPRQYDITRDFKCVAILLGAFASEDIGEAHADVSSAAVEAYAIGNATFHMMGMSYFVEEMGLQMDKPFILEVDNQAEFIFTKGNAQKTKLKHIDCRQEK